MALLLTLLLLFCLILPAEGFGKPIKLVILPFKVYADQDLSYLESGVPQMLKSRLSWEEHILVMETPSQETENMSKINADYVIYGSLTIFGNSASLDISLTKTENGKTITFFNQCNNLDEIVTKVGELAEEVIKKLIPPAPVYAETPKPPTVEKIREAAPRKKEIKREEIKLCLFVLPGLFSKLNPAQTYRLFLSDKPQVEGKDPILTEEYEGANFPSYRRAGKIVRKGLDLGTITVKKAEGYNCDVTEFIKNHRSKQYFLAIKREGADYYLPVEVYFEKGLPSGKKTLSNKVIFDQGFDNKADALEFNIGRPE